MQILPAHQPHLPQIVALLQQDYSKANQALGRDYYTTDYDKLFAITEQRLHTLDSKYHYFILQDQEEIKGLLLLYHSSRRGELLMLTFQDEETEQNWIQKLLEFGINFLKEKGASFITFESAPYESTYQSLLEKLNAQPLSTKRIL